MASNLKKDLILHVISPAEKNEGAYAVLKFTNSIHIVLFKNSPTLFLSFSKRNRARMNGKRFWFSGQI